jgi:hypothetical protein
LLTSAITLNGNLLSNAMAIENNSYNNYDNSQRYEEDYTDKYRIEPSQQSNNEDNYGFDDKNKPPEIFPANKVSELGDRWWQWVASLNNITDPNPFTDLGQSGCDVGLQDDGKLLFLVGSIKGPEGFVEHECGVKQGTAILFPILNVLCDDLEGFPFFGATEQEQRICANNLINNASALHANIDGYEVIDPEQYRIDSPAGGFEFTAAGPANPVSIPPGNGTGVSDGFWILLKPFKPGEHTITFSGNLTFPNGFVSEIGATYFLDVHKSEKPYDSNNYQQTQNYPTPDYPQNYPTLDYPQNYTKY